MIFARRKTIAKLANEHSTYDSFDPNEKLEEDTVVHIHTE
jgi:hypothetical protein